MSYSIVAGPLYDRILSASPFRHLIHGPSPLNTAQLEFLPRLSAAIQVCNHVEIKWFCHGYYRKRNVPGYLIHLVHISIVSDCRDWKHRCKLESSSERAFLRHWCPRICHVCSW